MCERFAVANAKQSIEKQKISNLVLKQQKKKRKEQNSKGLKLFLQPLQSTRAQLELAKCEGTCESDRRLGVQKRLRPRGRPFVHLVAMERNLEKKNGGQKR